MSKRRSVTGPGVVVPFVLVIIASAALALRELGHEPEGAAPGGN